MRVLFASTRGAGHFNPLVPFIEACIRGGHEVLLAGPPPLAETVERAGYRHWPGEAPPEDELGEVWGRIPNASYEEAERLVLGDIFARLNVAAMLPSLRAAGEEWQPDLILRETAEYASAIAGEEHTIPHARVAVSLAAGEEQALSIAGPVLDERRRGIAERIGASPYLSLFPASLEDPQADQPPVTHRFRDPADRPASEPLPAWWADDIDPLVYISFGSVTGSMPIAGPIFAAVFEAVAELPARVLLTIGHETNADVLDQPPANVHVARWVPQADVFGPPARWYVTADREPPSEHSQRGCRSSWSRSSPISPTTRGGWPPSARGWRSSPATRPRARRCAARWIRVPCGRPSKPCSRIPSTGAPR